MRKSPLSDASGQLQMRGCTGCVPSKPFSGTSCVSPHSPSRRARATRRKPGSRRRKRCRDARGEDDGAAEEVVALANDLARVQADPHADRRPRRLRSRDAAIVVLHRDRARDCRRGVRETRPCIRRPGSSRPSHRDAVPASRTSSSCARRSMLGARVTEALVELGIALDVGEQHGDRAVGRGMAPEIGTLDRDTGRDDVDRRHDRRARCDRLAVRASPSALPRTSLVWPMEFAASSASLNSPSARSRSPRPPGRERAGEVVLRARPTQGRARMRSCIASAALMAGDRVVVAADRRGAEARGSGRPRRGTPGVRGARRVRTGARCSSRADRRATRSPISARDLGERTAACRCRSTSSATIAKSSRRARRA